MSDADVRAELERIDNAFAGDWVEDWDNKKFITQSHEAALRLLAETSLRDRESQQALGEILKRFNEYADFDAPDQEADFLKCNAMINEIDEIAVKHWKGTYKLDPKVANEIDKMYPKKYKGGSKADAKPFSDEELKQFDKRYGSEHIIARFKATIAADRKVIKHWQDGFNKAENRIEELEKEMRERTRLWHNANVEVKQQATTIEELQKIVKGQCDPEDYQAMIVERDLQAATIKRLRSKLENIAKWGNQMADVRLYARQALDRKEE